MQTSQEAALPASRQVTPQEMGQRMILHGVSWATYERLLADFQDSHAAHFAYDRGVLEIMAPSFKHETVNRTLAAFIEMLAEGMEVDVVNAGSTTFKREDLLKGFEPDTCFYMQNAEHIRAKEEIDLAIDPPPDLVIEVDITSPSLNKLPIYAAVGVPEVWRCDGREVTIYKLLENGQYQLQEASVAFPSLTSKIITQFVEDSQTMKRTVWIRRVREWAQQQKRP